MARKYGETLMIVTHDPEIARYAGRVITIHDGCKVSDETVSDGKANEEEQQE
jgi:putative ABC transport system ATP-binding protein